MSNLTQLLGMPASTLLTGIGTPTYNTIQGVHDITRSAGHLDGGEISDAGSGNITVAAGSGFIRGVNNDTSTLFTFNWATLGATAIPLNSIRYVFVDYNGGAPNVQVATTDSFDYRTQYPLGFVVNEGGVLYVNSTPHSVGRGIGRLTRRNFEVDGRTRAHSLGGLIISESGTKKIAMSTGVTWFRGLRNSVAAFDSNAAGTFDRYYRNGAGGWAREAAQTTLPLNTYDDGSGTPATVGNNSRAIYWVYLGPADSIVLVYGRGTYNTASDAQAAQPPSDLPLRLQVGALLLGRFITLRSGGSSTVEAVETSFGASFVGGGAITHNNLAGLQGGTAGEYLHITSADATKLARTITGTTNQINVTNGDGVSGNPTLSLSSTVFAPGTLGVSGNFATGGSPTTDWGGNFNTILTGSTAQIGLRVGCVSDIGATNSMIGISVHAFGNAGSHTTVDAMGIRITNYGKGASQIVTTQTGLNINALTAGTTNYALRSQTAAGANNWNLYLDGTAKNYLQGTVTIGTATDDGVNKLQVTGATKITGNLSVVGAIDETRGANIASASTINLTTATGNYVSVTGTTTITAITLADGAQRRVRFTGILTLTNGASLLLPTEANITTAVGDIAVFIGEASSVVRCVSYVRASGAALAGGANPGGTTGEIQYNNAGAFDGAANVEIHGGDLYLIANSTPTVPPTGGVKLFARSIAGRQMAAIIGPSGLDTALQPMIARNKVAFWNPIGNVTTVPTTFGTGAPTALGTATARNVATTNIATRMKRLGYVSGAVAGNMAGHWNPVAITQYTIGTGAGLGGFTLIMRIVISDAATVSGARMFCGMSSQTSAATNVDPAGLTNVVGVAQLASSTNLHIVYGGSAAQTAIDLGADFPCQSGSADAYDIAIFAPPSSNTSVGYRVERLGTAFIAEGTLSGTAGVALPASTTLLGPRLWRTNNATALAVGIDIASWYIETDQ